MKLAKHTEIDEGKTLTQKSIKPRLYRADAQYLDKGKRQEGTILQKILSFMQKLKEPMSIKKIVESIKTDSRANSQKQ